MDLGNFSSQSHVAQQSRRDKLRVQQSVQHLADYPIDLDQLNPNHAHISNIRYSNISYDSSLIPSEMHNFAMNNYQQNCVPWRGCDWAKYIDGATVGLQNNQNAYTIGEGSMDVTKAYDSPSSLYRHQVVNSSNFTNLSSEILSQNSQNHYEKIHYNPSLFYQNALTTVSTEGLELASNIDQSNIHLPSRDMRNTIGSDSVAQGLSLSLTPVHPNKARPSQLPEGLLYPIENFKSDYLDLKPKPSIVASSSKVFGNTGPLGPFTGYATILKSSKFLKPAQQLLDDMCKINASKFKDFDDAMEVVDDSSVSSPRFYGSNGRSEEVFRTRMVESIRPDYQQKKANLLFMQEEISRRHKQYNQQMEMVVTSFETVPGLSVATPYVSLALKAVSRHFRSLKNAISDQIKYIRKLLGENLSSAVGDASTSTKGNTSSSRLKFVDSERFMKHKTDGGSLGFSDPQQPPAWRPQRGLPERSVAVLRAWLFDHFLHPYPTDADKHMLASQTGLSRDQVSNWFINARVRVWKPMVEEIHALETKVLATSNSNAEGAVTDLHATSSTKAAEHAHNQNRWNRDMEKRIRTEYQIPASTIDTSLVGFMPFQRSGLGVEIAGIEPVSLTLGLRQNPEEMGPQQYQQQGHQQQHFEGQMVHHNFAG